MKTLVAQVLTAPRAEIPWQGGPGRLIALAQEAGLTGRGGAGFPTWRKLTEVATAHRPVVVANAAEGEPASRKDAELLARNPHLVLDGLQLAAETVGASKCYLYASRISVEHAREALRQRKDRWPVTVVEAPDLFVAGEESAVLSAVDGKKPLPRDKPRLPVHQGFLVQNVETLAHLALIARHGPSWFRREGTHDEPGTFLATLSGAVANPGVQEAPFGVPLNELLQPAEPLQAVLVGGYHGRWVPWTSEPVSRPGAGVFVALAESVCGLDFSAQVMTYLAGQSARQCGPCLNGLPRIAALLTALAQRRATPATVTDLNTLAGFVIGRGACRHPDGSARFLHSTLTTFDDEIAAHLRGTCRSRR